MKKLSRLFLIVVMLLALGGSNVALGSGRELTFEAVEKLNALSSDPVNGDFVPVYDASADEVKRFDATLFRSGHNSGSTTLVLTASHILAAQLAFGVITQDMESSGSNLTVEIADGLFRGQFITLTLINKSGGNWIIGEDTPGSITSTGWSTITFDTALDSITLVWIDDSTGWAIHGNNGCTIG